MRAELKGKLWVISVEPNELQITATRFWPYASHIGVINQRGTISVWRPAAGAPRNWGEIARYKLEDARAELYRKGDLVDRKAVKARKEETKTGSVIVRLSNGKTARFHDMPRSVAWAEEALRGKAPGTVAEFYRALPQNLPPREGMPWTVPFHVLVVDSYGRIVMEGAPSAPKRSVGRDPSPKKPKAPTYKDYTKRYKFPKWNVMPSVLMEPRLMKRVPSFSHMTKADHLALSEEHQRRFRRFSTIYKRLADDAYERYGERGPLISGSLQEHFPEKVKERLREAALRKAFHSDAAYAHRAASKFRRMG